MEISRVDNTEGIEFYFADGVMVKQLVFPFIGAKALGHAHVYDHTSMLARGKLRVWEDGKLVGDFAAPTGLFIKAGVFHEFVALEDHTVLYCIHNTHGFGPDDAEANLVKERAKL